MLALPIFPVRSKYRFAVRNMPAACYRQSNTKVQKSSTFLWSLCWRYLFSRPVTRQVSSAQVSLTSVFGMGTGGPSPQSTPTTSIQASYPLLPRKRQSSLIPLYLLSEQNPLRRVFVRYICNQVSLKTSLLYYFYRICQVLFLEFPTANDPAQRSRMEKDEPCHSQAMTLAALRHNKYREQPSTAVVSGSDEQRNERAFELARMRAICSLRRAGDPYRIRTDVNGVRGHCLNHLTNGPFGAPSRTRTGDPLIKSQLLYQLS